MGQYPEQQRGAELTESGYRLFLGSELQGLWEVFAGDIYVAHKKRETILDLEKLAGAR